MPRVTNTKSRILEVAQDAVLAKGFDATSIEEIVAAAEITRGGFFYHFKDKNALASELLARYIEDEDALFDAIEAEAKTLADDPLGALLVGLELLARKFDDMAEGHPGCLIASATYQDRLFDAGVRQMNYDALKRWRARFRAQFDDIVVQYPPKDEVDLDGLADMLVGVIEGALILSKVYQDPPILGQQVRLFKGYVRLLFSAARH